MKWGEGCVSQRDKVLTPLSSRNVAGPSVAQCVGKQPEEVDAGRGRACRLARDYAWNMDLPLMHLCEINLCEIITYTGTEWQQGSQHTATVPTEKMPDDTGQIFPKTSMDDLTTVGSKIPKIPWHCRLVPYRHP